MGGENMKGLKRIMVLVIAITIVYSVRSDNNHFYTTNLKAVINNLKGYIQPILEEEQVAAQSITTQKVDSKQKLYEVLNKAASQIETNVHLELGPNYSIAALKADLTAWSYAYVEGVKYSYKTLKGAQPKFVDVMMNYYTSGKVYKKLVLNKDVTLNAQEEELYQLVKVILNECVDVKSQYQTELNIHDWIINHSSYSSNVAKNGQDAYYLLSSSSKGVCNAYADAMHLLLNSAGIECIKVVGISRNESHAWNQVKIDDKWYEVDVTWDDPVVEGEGETLSHKYFNLTTKEMSKDHQRDENVIYKNCTALEANYYEKESIKRAQNIKEAEKMLEEQLKDNLKSGSAKNRIFNLEVHLNFNMTNEGLQVLQENLQGQIRSIDSRGYTIDMKSDGGTGQLTVMIKFS